VGQRVADPHLWAIENVNGLGRLLSQQLVLAGEQVVDVPASPSHRTRKLSGKSGCKTDPHDARSVAIAAANPGRLRTVELEDFSQALGLILDRRRHLVSFRHRTICRLHALLAEMIPGGGPEAPHPGQSGQTAAFGASSHGGRSRTA
jgi:transposase